MFHLWGHGGQRPKCHAARIRHRGIGSWLVCLSRGSGSILNAQKESFDADLIAQVCEMAGSDGILGNCHAPGTAIIEEFGAEHMRTGPPDLLHFGR